MSSPNLRDTKEKTNEGAERRRLLRLNLSSEQFKHAETGKIFSVQDLSESGMALRIIDSEDLILFTAGRKFEGHLKIRDLKYRLSATVRYQGRDRIGCEFEELDPKFKDKLRTLLDPKTIGADLRPVPTTEPKTLWYHATSGTDVVIKRDFDASLIAVDIFMFGSYVRWGSETPLETGQVRPSHHSERPAQASEVRGVTRFETLCFYKDSKPNLDTLKIAKELILGSILGNDLKNKILRKIA